MLIDALGTLVRLRPPGPLLREELARRGVTVSEADAEAAFRAEIEWYRAHQLEGRDAEGLERLRAACAEAMNDALPEPLDPAVAREVMMAALRFDAYEDAVPALMELRGRGLKVVVVSNWDASLREVLERLGLLRYVDAVVTSAEAGVAKPERAIFEEGLRAAGVGAAEAVHVGDSATLDVAGAERAGIRALLLDRDSAGGGAERLRTLRELPQAIERPPWPAWFGPVGLLAAFGVALFGAVFVGAAAEASGGEADSPGVIRIATLIQDAAFIGVALWLAAKVARPAAHQFGLRRPALWPAVGWAVLGALGYLAFAGAYTALIAEPETQTTLDDLGARDSTATLILVGVMVIVLAPVVEEFFFRGFFYTALRTRFGVLSAAAIDGLVFGGIHVVTGAEAVPLLAALGFAFCLVYERTGSLWPVIVLHALNNWIGYASQTDEGATASAIGAVMVAGCFLLAAASRPARRAVA